MSQSSCASSCMDSGSGAGVGTTRVDAPVELYPDELERLMGPIPHEDTAAVSDRSVKAVANELNLFEKTGPALNSEQIESMHTFLEFYHDNASNQLIGRGMSIMPEEVSTAAREVVETLPRMTAPLYYPMVVTQEQHFSFLRPGKIIKFEHEMMVMPSHFLNTDLQYQMLANQKNINENVVLIKVDSKSMRPITRFSDQPESIDFLLDQKNSLFQVTTTADFEHGLYDKMITVIAKPETPSRLARAITVSNHRLKTGCQ
ncbi:MAG: hypothetical protein ISP86_02220 [Shewanellaceae bacterium]|nr:hypothetical protein [Shewanellaceae bacterium]